MVSESMQFVSREMAERGRTKEEREWSHLLHEVKQRCTWRAERPTERKPQEESVGQCFFLGPTEETEHCASERPPEALEQSQEGVAQEGAEAHGVFSW